jgi:hypothetical protein
MIKVCTTNILHEKTPYHNFFQHFFTMFEKYFVYICLHKKSGKIRKNPHFFCNTLASRFLFAKTEKSGKIPKKERNTTFC